MIVLFVIIYENLENATMYLKKKDSVIYEK